MTGRTCPFSLIELLIRLHADHMIRVIPFGRVVRDFEKHINQPGVQIKNIKCPRPLITSYVKAKRWFTERSLFYDTTREEVCLDPDPDIDPYYYQFEEYINSPEKGDRGGQNQVAIELFELDQPDTVLDLCNSLGDLLPVDIQDALANQETSTTDKNSTEELVRRLQENEVPVNEVILTRRELKQLEGFLSNLTSLGNNLDAVNQSETAQLSPADVSRLQQIRDYYRLWYRRLRMKIEAAEKARGLDFEKKVGDQGTGPGGRPKIRKRGRPRADDATQKRESDLVKEWRQARDTGIYKADFAKDKGLMPADFDRLLSRVEAREHRSNKKLRR